MDSQSIVSVAIQAFIKDTGASAVGKEETLLPQTRPPTFKRSSHIINNKNLKVEKSLQVLKLNNTGYLKELALVADQKINLMIMVDDRDLFDTHSTFDDLSAITLYSDTVTARHDEDNYVVNIKDVSFKNSINIKVWFDTRAVILNMFGVYDICEAI